MGKGYKLTSAGGDGPKMCAFFLSDKGCRNGASCKFSHDKSAAAASGAPPTSPPSVSSSSVVSSESEGEVVERRAGAYASLAQGQVDVRAVSSCVNPFLAGAPPTTAPPTTTAPVAPPPQAPAPQQQQQQPSAEKKKKDKKRKKSLAPGENVFDLGTSDDRSPPTPQPAGTAPPQTAATTAAPPAKKAKKPKVSKAAPSPPAEEARRPPTAIAYNAPPGNNNATPGSHAAPTAGAGFRGLNLPIASFSLPATLPASTPPRPPTPQHEPAPTPPPLPLPTATPAHQKWKAAVVATRGHANYPHAFNYERAQQFEFSAGISTHIDWIAAKPYGKWCAANPPAIAIDCEMCQARDPITGRYDDKALCRISVVNAERPEEVLLDTLVKPAWPVSDHRTWVNGISAKDLEHVQFTLKHAQQFMTALCSDQTVIVGHAVHNDLLALRMVHHCNVDTAMLYVHKEEDAGTPSLKNLAHGVLNGREMPEVHDSVNDARVALLCAEHYVTRNGKVDPVEKVYSRSSSRVGRRTDDADTSILLVHRLPTSTLPEHLSEMFVAYTSIKPKKVPDISFSGAHGKCHVEFTTKEHADLAYRTLVGDEREDKTGKKQKRVGLKGGGYVCVRRMRK